MTIERNVSLKELTTFKLGGPARYFCRARSVDDLRGAVEFARKEKLPLAVLGGGSNVLVPDRGFDGLVVKMETLGITFTDRPRGRVLVTAAAGEDWDYLVSLAVNKGLWGVENLSGIPGTVGGAPVQNIGAYGAELKDVVGFVEVFDTQTFKLRKLRKRDCGFSYRHSVFKTPLGRKFIITAVGILLNKKGGPHLDYKDLAAFFAGRKRPPALPEVRRAVLEIRGRKFPDLKTCGTAGSFFKNPLVSKKTYRELLKRFPALPSFPAVAGRVKLPLGWIIERICGLKGARDGKVGTFEKQALVLVNHGGASACDVAIFADKIARSVKEKTGLNPEWEVVRLE